MDLGALKKSLDSALGFIILAVDKNLITRVLLLVLGPVTRSFLFLNQDLKTKYYDIRMSILYKLLMLKMFLEILKAFTLKCLINRGGQNKWSVEDFC